MWLGFGTSTAMGTGSTPGQGAKLPQDATALPSLK